MKIITRNNKIVHESFVLDKNYWKYTPVYKSLFFKGIVDTYIYNFNN